MKKLLALMLLLVICISFGCLTSDSGNDADNSSDTTYTITGTAKDNSGNGIAGVSVNLTGYDKNLNVTTGADGSFSFSNIGNGSYTVTPSKNSYTFTPSNRQVTVENADMTVDPFTGAAAGGNDAGEYSISGRFLDNAGVAIPDVMVVLA